MTVVERKSYYAGYTSQIAILGLITICQHIKGEEKLKLEIVPYMEKRASNLKFFGFLQ